MTVGERIQALWARTEPLRLRWANTEAGAHRHLETADSPSRTQRILVFSGLTGVAVGLIVVVLDKAAHDWLADPMARQPLWLQAAGPAIGLLVAWAALGALTDKATPDTTDEYVRGFHHSPSEPPDPNPAVGRAVAGVGTIGYGGALSLEGPAVYVGSVVGAWVQTRFSRFFSREDARALLVAGAAAGMSAVFKAPATGALFAIEVPYQSDVARRVALPAIIGAAASYVTAALVDDLTPLLPLNSEYSSFGAWELVGAVVVGLLCGAAARGFSLGLVLLHGRAARIPSLARLAVAGVALFGLAYLADALFDTPLTIGPGYDVVTWVGDPTRSLWLILALLLMRGLATSATATGGGVGGYFVPLAVAGALLGRLAGEVMSFDDTNLFLVVGMAAFIGAGLRTPLAAVLFAAEATGQPGFVVPALVATAAGQLVIGRASVSRAQREGRLGHLERRFDLPISAVLETDVRTVPPDATVEEFLAVHLLATRRRAVPVVDHDNRYRGVALLDELAAVPRDAWATTTVGNVAHGDAPRGMTTWLIRDAVQTMQAEGTDLLPIVDGEDRFVGVVTTGDILRLDEILEKTTKA
ncbi:MAG TPA: chloride channel protein [Acidimicrobiales bacterium]|nr:chloride channel protein [Acidimicrobiales bacterium]